MSFVVVILFIVLIIFLFRTRGRRLRRTSSRIFRPSAERLGKIGESQIASRLGALSLDNYVVMNDLLLRDGDYTTQIDHLIISRYGVFVVETKNIHGTVYGADNKEFWSSYLPQRYSRYLGKAEYEFRNPLWQNAGHIRAIKKIVGNDVRVQGIVAFPNETELKVKCTQPVLYWSGVMPYIEQFTEAVLSDEEIVRLDALIRSYVDANPESRLEHVENVRKQQGKRNAAVAAGKCPLCGGTLVRRNGRYGSFWGCSNYPTCKYTLNS